MPKCLAKSLSLLVAHRSGRLRFFMYLPVPGNIVQIRASSQNFTKQKFLLYLGKFFSTWFILLYSGYLGLFIFYFSNFRKLSFERAFLGFDLHHYILQVVKLISLFVRAFCGVLFICLFVFVSVVLEKVM